MTWLCALLPTAHWSMTCRQAISWEKIVLLQNSRTAAQGRAFSFTWKMNKWAMQKCNGNSEEKFLWATNSDLKTSDHMCTIMMKAPLALSSTVIIFSSATKRSSSAENLRLMLSLSWSCSQKFNKLDYYTGFFFFFFKGLASFLLSLLRKKGREGVLFSNQKILQSLWEIHHIINVSSPERITRPVGNSPDWVLPTGLRL